MYSKQLKSSGNGYLVTLYNYRTVFTDKLFTKNIHRNCL